MNGDLDFSCFWSLHFACWCVLAQLMKDIAANSAAESDQWILWRRWCEQTTAEWQQFLTGMGAAGNSCQSWSIKVVSGLLQFIQFILSANCLLAVPAAKQCTQPFLLSPALAGPAENTPEPALRMRTWVHQNKKSPCFPLQNVRNRFSGYLICTSKTIQAAVRNKDVVFRAFTWLLKLWFIQWVVL